MCILSILKKYISRGCCTPEFHCFLLIPGKHPSITPNGMLPRNLTPSAVIKPELYFPQCYAPTFNPQPTAGPFSGASSGAQTPLGAGTVPEFKPANGLPAQWLTAGWQLGHCIGWASRQYLKNIRTVWWNCEYSVFLFLIFYNF